MAEPTSTETSKYVNVLLDEGLLAAIDEFRFDNRFESRTAAMRWLLQAGIDLKLAPKLAAPKAPKKRVGN